MKICSWCGKVLPEEATVCDVDGQPMVGDSSLNEENPFPTGAILAGAAILVFFVGLMGIAGFYLFRLVSACWAYADCFRLGKRGFRGYRALGIVFKPIVVFGVCAFFLGGFGLIWYLIMRKRVAAFPDQAEDSADPLLGEVLSVWSDR
jgi:hypothetical protein